MSGWREIGWSSRHTATGLLRQPIPRVYELDVVRDGNGWSGTVIGRQGGWLMVESDCITDFMRVDDVEVEWTP